MTNFVGSISPSNAPTRQPSQQSLSIQEEGNACFDMAAAIPGLQNLTGNHLVSISTNRLTQLFNDFYASSFPLHFPMNRWIICVTVHL